MVTFLLVAEDQGDGFLLIGLHLMEWYDLNFKIL